MSEIRSLHIVPSLDRGQGGLATAALGICQQLAVQGHPVEILTSRGADDSVDHVATEFPSVTVHYLPRTFPERFSNCAAMSGWIRENARRFDVVEIHGVFMFLVFRAASALAGVGLPYLLRPHGSLDPFDLRKKKWIKKLIGPLFTRKLAERSAGIVSTCDLESELLELYGAHPARYVVPLPVPTVTQASAEDGVAFRKKHGIPGDAFVVLFLSRIDYKKGLNYLLPALAALKKEFPKVWLVMAGGGQQAFVEGIRAEVAARGMTGWTVFPGFLSGTDKMSAFRAADLFALPSQNENFGIVVVEALQCGLPSLISTGVYIHREIAARDAAVVCEPNEDSCRDGLKKLIADPALRAKLRERSAAAARELYSPESANRTLLELYARVVARTPSKPAAPQEMPQAIS